MAFGYCGYLVDYYSLLVSDFTKWFQKHFRKGQSQFGDTA